MAKNIENINPFHEEVHEDEARIYKNDKKHSYVPEEQIKASVEDVTGDVSEDTDSMLEDYEDEKRDEISQQKNIELLKNEIKFQQSEGSISVGPDVEGKNLEEYHNSNLGEDVLLTSTNSESMNPAKSRTVVSDYEIRKYKKSDKYIGRGKDNLKTLTKNKRERSFGKMIKDFFTKQNLEETPEHKFEAMVSDHTSTEGSSELSGRPVDKRFIEEEENKAA